MFFVVSLGYFLYAYMIRFGTTSADGFPARALTWNVALFTIFALHHSVFARTKVRAWIAAVCSERLERSVYVWIASLLFILVCATWQPIAGTAWKVDGSVRWLLWTVQLVAIWLILHSATVLDVFELAGLRQIGAGKASGAGGTSQARPEDPASPTRLTSPTRLLEFKQVGPYRWVRHPIYFGWLLFVFAASPMTMTRLTFAVISSAYLLVAIPFEERTLRRTSGGAYDWYMRQVRWKLVPGVF
ncbi:MAG TPA: NnrU family protein [Roseiflexaceae bacterium]